MKANKIIVAVNLEEEALKPLHQLKDLDIGHSSEIHLVHVFPSIFYSEGMNFTAISYPQDNDKPKLKQGIVEKLKKLKTEIFPDHQNVKYECLFGVNEKAVFTDYTDEQKADLVVIATRGKRGLKTVFDSSFAQHQLKYSHVNVLVLKEKN